MDIDAFVKEKHNKIVFSNDVLEIYLKEKEEDILLDKISQEFRNNTLNELQIKKAIVAYEILRNYINVNCVEFTSKKQMIFL
ncbi:hypothetical protein [Clostridium botulinum]|uniref:hypothetical protein n=1 Tax=Clostridium botulinum TaxID=1491 RepID=UPI0004D032DC|nr:hypothetical protein [Clostridium botulinum]